MLDQFVAVHIFKIRTDPAKTIYQSYSTDIDFAREAAKIVGLEYKSTDTALDLCLAALRTKGIEMEIEQ